jgi:hypothetical protein
MADALAHDRRAAHRQVLWRTLQNLRSGSHSVISLIEVFHVPTSPVAIGERRNYSAGTTRRYLRFVERFALHLG